MLTVGVFMGRLPGPPRRSSPGYLMTGLRPSLGLPLEDEVRSTRRRGLPDLFPNLAHLAGQLLLDMVSPHGATRTQRVRTILQAGQLLAPFSNQGGKPEQLRLQFEDFAFFAFHDG